MIRTIERFVALAFVYTAMQYVFLTLPLHASARSWTEKATRRLNVIDDP